MVSDFKPGTFVVALLCGAPLHVGGVETHLTYLLAKGDRHRYRFLLVAPASEVFTQKVRELGAAVMPWRPQSWGDLGAVSRLFCVLKRERADLLHTHDARCRLAASLVAKRLGIPVVHTVHLPAYYYAVGEFRRRLYERVERFWNHHFSERVVYTSASVYEEAIQRGSVSKDRARLIPNGIDVLADADPEAVRFTRRAFGVCDERPVICFVGRLSREKGPDLLIEAAHKLVSAGCLFHLWLVGDGPLRSNLEERAQSLGRAVSFLGFQQDVFRVLAASDIVVLPSRYEGGASFAIMEAMAAGRPCVVTQVGDNGRLIQDGVEGLVVPPENASALTAALGRLLQDGGLRQSMGTAAKRRSLQHSAVAMVRDLQQVYEEVLLGRGL